MSSRQSLLWIPKTARSLATAGVTHGRSWSLGQVCEHLALAFDATQPIVETDGARTRGSVWKRAKQFVMKRVLLLTGWFPDGVPAPHLVVPSNSPPLNTMLDRLEAAIRGFEQAFDRSESRWPDHPVLGPMSGREWRRFHSLHAAHHFKFFRDPLVYSGRRSVLEGPANQSGSTMRGSRSRCESQ